MLLILSLEAIWSSDIAAQRAKHKTQTLANFLEEQTQINVAASQLVPLSSCSATNANADDYSLALVRAQGYAGLIEIYALIGEHGRRELKLAGFASHGETPGFVDRLNRSWFQEIILDLEQGNDIDAISGATISSQAVIEALLYCASEL